MTAHRRRRLTIPEICEMQKLAKILAPPALAEHFGVTVSTVKQHCASSHLHHEPQTIDPLPDNAIGKLTKKLGYATIEPTVRDLIKAYEDGRAAALKWGETANCFYGAEFAQAWALGYDIGMGMRPQEARARKRG